MYREEPYLCAWCNRRALPGESLCQECKEEQAIRNMSFGEFWNHLRNEADGVEIDVLHDAGWLEMRWMFDSQYTKLKIAKLLQQRGAKRWVGHSSVHFWVEVDKGGRMDLVAA